MQIGIGLPAHIPRVQGKLLLDWARKADTGPFSSLAVIDRVVYPNFEPMITLAAAAGATQRIRLMTTVLLAPLRTSIMLAKEAASLDALSGGRLTLGLGVGGREDDFQATTMSFHDRGKRLDEQLATMKRVWAGQSASDTTGPIGPPPGQKGGPELLIGANSPTAIKRVARWGDGFISSGGSAERALQGYNIAAAAWRDAGRPGKPRFVGCLYMALGPNAAERGAENIRHYYSFFSQLAEQIATSHISTPEAVKRSIESYAGIGADELIFWPMVTDLEQVDRLAELAG